MNNKKKTSQRKKNAISNINRKNTGQGTVNRSAIIDIIASRKSLILAAIMLILAVYCLHKVVELIKNPTDTFSVEQGRIFQEESATGYISREETVVKGENYKNGMSQIKTEGERVAKDEAIFRYYSSGEESLTKKIEELDSKIDEAIESEDNNIFSGDIRNLEKQIEEKIESLVQVNDLQAIKETKKDISNSITKKAKIAGELSPFGSYLKKLIDERSGYENELNLGAEYLKAPISGVVSYKVDGYEEILTPNNLSSLSKDFLSKIDTRTGQVVADNGESGKIINNFKCYIACVLNSEQAKNVQVGDKIKIRLPNNAETTTNVIQVTQEDGDIIIVLELAEQVQELVSYRKISFDIIWWSYSGKKVPNTAIGGEIKGNKEISYVVRTRAGYQDKILIKIDKQNEKYSIVENYTNAELQELGYTLDELKGRKTLTLYDEILKNPTGNE